MKKFKLEEFFRNSRVAANELMAVREIKKTAVVTVVVIIVAVIVDDEVDVTLTSV